MGLFWPSSGRAKTISTISGFEFGNSNKISYTTANPNGVLTGIAGDVAIDNTSTPAVIYFKEQDDTPWAQLNSIQTVDVTTTNGTTIYAIENGNTEIVKSTNSGSSFADIGPTFTGVTKNLTNYGDTVYVLTKDTNDYNCRKSTDGGSTFAAGVLVETTATALDPNIFTSDGITVWVALNLKLWKSTDGGATFALAYTAANAIKDVATLDNTNIYIATSDGIYKSTNGGTSFSSIGLSGQTTPVIAIDESGTIFTGYYSVNFQVYACNDDSTFTAINGFTGSSLPFGLAVYAGILYFPNSGVAGLYSGSYGDGWVALGTTDTTFVRKEKTSAYTALTTDDYISCIGTFTVTLYPKANFIKPLTIRSDGSGTITVDGNGAETIDGATTATLVAGSPSSITLVPNATEWTIN